MNAPTGTVFLHLAYFGTDYVEKEEYLTYAFGDLVADFGGFLGLLLGYSLLSLYDMGSHIFWLRCNKAAKT
jgi:hypothetical protein